MQKCFIFVEKNVKDKHAKDIKYYKGRDYCHYTKEYRGAAHSTYNLRYSVPKTILIVFHN